jgi:cell shape-determining protein MreC
LSTISQSEWLASTLELIKRIEVLKLQNKELRKKLQSLSAKESNAKAAVQRNRLSKPLKGRSPKNAVQADMIASAIDRAIGGDS